MSKKVYAFDLDGTLCDTPNGNDYANSVPIRSRIIRVNLLHNAGHNIIIYTARGCKSGCTPELRDLTKKQLLDWKISHDSLVMGQKIFYDILVDDKAISVDQWDKESEVGTLGIIAGSFDIMHPGYIKQFNEAREICSRILVCLQEKGKRPPLVPLDDRIEMLESLRQVDRVMVYKTENDLLDVLKINCPHVRILGSDYLGRNYTGQELGQDVYYANRDHGWSTTSFLSKIRKNNNHDQGNRNRRKRKKHAPNR